MRWEFREVEILKSKHLSKKNSSSSCWSWQIFGPLLLSPNALNRRVCLSVGDVSFNIFIMFRIAIPHVHPLSSLLSQSYLSSNEQPIFQVQRETLSSLLNAHPLLQNMTAFLKATMILMMTMAIDVQRCWKTWHCFAKHNLHSWEQVLQNTF